MFPTHADQTSAAPKLTHQLSRVVRLSAQADDAYGVLRTPRLTLRPLQPNDWAEFARVMNVSRDHLARFCPLSKFAPGVEADLELFQRQLDLASAAVRTRRAWRMSAFDQQGRLVGAFNINDITRGLEHTAELVVWLSADQAGKGLALEGSRAVLAHAFADMPRGLGLHRMIALMDVANDPSERLLARLGFKPDKLGTDVALQIGGSNKPHRLYEAFAGVQQVTEQIERKPLDMVLPPTMDSAITRILAAEATGGPVAQLCGLAI